MDEKISVTTIQRPGVVLLAAILNFIACAGCFFVSAALIFVVVLGNAMNLQQRAIQTVTDRLPQLTAMTGAGIILMAILFLAITMIVYNLVTGIGLIKGKKFAWYLQVTTSIIGLLGFPLWTIINGVILFLFFRKPVRDYFKV